MERNVLSGSPKENSLYGEEDLSIHTRGISCELLWAHLNKTWKLTLILWMHHPRKNEEFLWRQHYTSEQLAEISHKGNNGVMGTIRPGLCWAALNSRPGLLVSQRSSAEMLSDSKAPRQANAGKGTTYQTQAHFHNALAYWDKILNFAMVAPALALLAIKHTLCYYPAHKSVYQCNFITEFPKKKETKHNHPRRKGK